MDANGARLPFPAELKAAAAALAEAQVRITLAAHAIELVHLQAEGRAKATLEQGVEHGLYSLPAPSEPASDYRREHRPGRQRIISADPELRVFIVARIDRMTFDQIATDVARHFPSERRVRKSAIHAWWKANLKPPKPLAGRPADHPG